MPMVLAEEIIPWAAALVRSGQTVVVSSVRSLPRDAEEDRKFMLSSEFSPKASILTPLVIDDRVIGAITFGDCKRSRRWPKELVRRLELVANIFGNAIARQRAALEANQLREAAAQASRAALAGEMAASITHELNHPLGAILANAQTARRMLEGPHPDLSELRQIMDDIIAGERRATHYMERVRHVHRNDRLQVEPLEVHSILNIVGNLVRASLLANRISLVIDVEPGLPRMAADRIATEQALLNLVRNGIEALTEAQPSPRTITIRGFRRDSGLVAISVADTGGGIPSTHLERIFEPFFTTREQGTGMGLAIVRSIVESQGGSIAVRGGSGTGAVFEFTVPEWQEIEEIG
jgi:signal transduction histidine kinase